MNLARALADEVFPELLAAQDSTPEALLDDMAGKKPKGLRDLPQSVQDLWLRGSIFAGQRGWVIDEFSGLLATAGRNYGAGLIEALGRFYDCDPLYRRSRRVVGWVVVRNSYMSLFGASTLAALHKSLLAAVLWSNGWWPRFGLLFPEGRRLWADSVETPRPPMLAEGLGALFQALPRPSGGEALEALSVQLAPGVHDAWRAYDRAMRDDLQTEEIGHMGACYGRLPTKALKIAALLAGLDWAGETEREKPPTIALRHWCRAQQIAETWRASGHRLLASIAKSETDAIEKRVLRIVTKAGPEGITLRDIGRRMHDKRRNDVVGAVQRLTGRGELLCFRYQPSSGGRPTERYRIT